MSKTATETLINTDLASGSLIPALNHRNVLKDDPDSILNVVYSASLSDSQATDTYLGFSDASTWGAQLSRVGRIAMIDMDVTAATALQLNAATITDASFLPDETYTTVGRLVSGGTIGIVVGAAGNISFQDVVFPGERVQFNLKYNVLS